MGVQGLEFRVWGAPLTCGRRASVAGLLLQARDLYQSGGGDGGPGLAALDPVITACRRKDLEINGQPRLPVVPGAGGGGKAGTGWVDSEREKAVDGRQGDVSVLSSVASPRSPHSPARRRVGGRVVVVWAAVS